MIHTKRPKRYPKVSLGVPMTTRVVSRPRIKWSKVLIITIVALGMMMMTSL